MGDKLINYGLPYSPRGNTTTITSNDAIVAGMGERPGCDVVDVFHLVIYHVVQGFLAIFLIVMYLIYFRK